MKVFIDIETIPDQRDGSINAIAEAMTVKAPSDLTKPKLIAALGLDIVKDKFKTVAELQDMWVNKFGETAKLEQAESKWLKTSFDGGCGEIIAIGLATENSDVVVLTGPEKSILEGLNLFIAEHTQLKIHEEKPYFIGHNSKQFDLPFLHKRYVINNIKPTYNFVAHGRHPANCFDTMEEWAGFNNRVSMDNLAKYLGVKGKTDGMDGSKVWPEFKAGNIKKIADYCADDVACTRVIYERLTFK